MADLTKLLIELARTGMTARLCDDCGERAATEIWDYSDAPIPNPPKPDHYCARCADQKRDRHAERMASGEL